MSDATLNVLPTADRIQRLEITHFGINPNAGPANATINLIWYTESGKAATDTGDLPTNIVLTGADLVAFLGAISPNAADGFMAVANPALRFRRRALAWLIDNGKLTGVTAA